LVASIRWVDFACVGRFDYAGIIGLRRSLHDKGNNCLKINQKTGGSMRPDEEYCSRKKTTELCYLPESSET